ncbi:MAG TPA: hypothetical protein VK849_08820 [Longimicrobiales bacterium]|nr:hypothetical protein [Longimicrobiales bacterium]
MPDPRPIANDSGSPMDVNVVGETPHVFAYRIWFRETDDEDWTVIGEGDTEDEIPDHFSTGPHPDDTRITMITAVGGTVGSTYRFLITFSQDGRMVMGGAITERGRIGDGGTAVRKTEVVLV